MQSEQVHMERKRREQELAELALHISEKSANEAADALLELYKSFRYLALEAEITSQFRSAEDELRARLEAKLASLKASTPSIELPKTPAPEPIPAVAGEPDLSPGEEPAGEVVEEDAPAPAAPPAPEAPQAPVAAAQAPEAPAATSVAEPAPVQVETPRQAPAPEATQASEPEPAAAQEVKATVADKANAAGVKKSLNDRLAQKVLKFGLNDRIGFVKRLFDGSTEDFNRVVSQLNTMSSLEEAQEFLATHVAPEYHWEKEEETAERFYAAVEQRFS